MRLVGLDGLGCISCEMAQGKTTNNTVKANYKTILVSNKNLADQGLTSTENFLVKNNIPFEKILGTGGNGDTYQVGDKLLNTFLPIENTTQLANQLKTDLQANVNTLQASITQPDNKKLWMLGLGFLGVVVVLSSLSGKEKKKKRG